MVVLEYILLYIIMVVIYYVFERDSDKVKIVNGLYFL